MSAHIKVTVDGKVRMDGDVSDWHIQEGTPEPELISALRQQITQGSAPWWQFILHMEMGLTAIAIGGLHLLPANVAQQAEALTRSREITITTRDNGSYTLDVEYV